MEVTKGVSFDKMAEITELQVRGVFDDNFGIIFLISH